MVKRLGSHAGLEDLMIQVIGHRDNVGLSGPAGVSSRDPNSDVIFSGRGPTVRACYFTFSLFSLSLENACRPVKSDYGLYHSRRGFAQPVHDCQPDTGRFDAGTEDDI